jgi:hypothetical protein
VRGLRAAARLAAIDSEEIMYAHRRAYCAAAAAGAALAFFLTACSPPPPAPVVGPDPADPNSGTPGIGSRSTLGPYSSQRPAAPALERAPNDGATPNR